MIHPKKKASPRFAKAFSAILRDPRLSAGAKGLYALLKTYCNEDGACWPSVETLAGHLNATKKTVSAWIKELCELRVVTKQSGKGGSSNQYLFQDEHFARFLAQKHRVKNDPQHRVKNDPRSRTISRESETPREPREPDSDL